MSNATLDTAAMQRLASKRIFFGHQSVGANVLDGVKELLAEKGSVRLEIVRNDAPESVEGPALIEASLGENGNPASKADAFAAVLERGMGDAGGIAMYKYCYLDMQPETDPVRLFDDYRARMDSLSARYPDLTVVHVTMPLTVVESGAKRFVKQLMGKTTALDLNAKRNVYNARLRAAYQGRAPIFDLATLESTGADGRRTFVADGRDTVFTLAPEWTDDGGHLNARARRLAAHEFLGLLARLQ